jgi:hypothetical protein
MYVPIKDNRNLLRDTSNMAILNTDVEELKSYYAQRDQKIQELEEKHMMEQKVNKLEQDITDIKDMLRQLVDKRT